MDIQYKKHAFAFIDLLKVKETLKNDSGLFLNKIKNIFKSVNTISRFEEFPDLKYKIFSDNIAIAIEVKDALDGGKEACELAYYISILQEFMLSNELLIRGGITIGDAYIDQEFVIGNALVKCYELESKVAIYPRVILDDSIIDNVKRYIEKTEHYEYCCKQDMDCKYFVDYLNSPGFNKKQRKASITKAIEFNENEIIHEKGNTTVSAKLLWNRMYFEYSIKRTPIF